MDTMDIKEAQERLNIGRSLAYKLIATGEIPSIRLGRAIRIPRKSFDRFLDQADSGLYNKCVDSDDDE